MKRHTRRLVKAGLLVAAAALVTGGIFYPLFAVDAGSLKGAAGYFGPGAAGTTRVIRERDYAEYGTYGTHVENIPLADEFQLVLENGECELYFREDTGEIALKRKGAENIWYSNPQDRENETMFGGRKKAAMAAQFSLTYLSDGLTGSMDSYNHCVEGGGLEYELTDTVLAVTYHVGVEKLSLADFPQQIEAGRWEEFLAKASDDTRKALKKRYTLLAKEKLSDKMYQKMVKDYPKLAEADLYYLNIKEGSDRYFQEFRGLLNEIGYTDEDLEYDNAWAGIEIERAVVPKFDVVLEYRLEGESLVVKMDTSRWVCEDGIPICSVDLLPYFGAGGLSDDGYLFIPDGSGSLIRFDAARSSAGRIELGIYGQEEIISQTSNYQISEGASLPVYGIQKGKEALFAEITQGAAKVQLIAAASGTDSSYHTVYPRCAHILSTLVRVTNNTQAAGAVAEDRHPYEGSYEIRYTPLKEDESGYVGMARYYRGQLIKRGELPQAETAPYLPLAVSVLGGTSSEKVILGITVPSVEPMTGYAQAGAIATDLKENGAEGVILRYMGWFNGGMDQSYAGKVKYIREMGGKKAYEELAEMMSARGIPFYPEVSFLNIDRTGKGFSASRMNARGVSRDLLVSYHYDAMDHYRLSGGTPVYRLKPLKLEDEVSAFLKNYRFDTGVSAADLGHVLYADYDDDTPVDRVSAAQLVGQAARILSENRSLMVSDPSLYTLGSADILVDVPCGDSFMEIEDEAVPFYQIVIRGSVDYMSKPLNYESDYRSALLKAVEYGAGLNYILMDQQPALLKETDFRQFYTGAYNDWRETVLTDYREAAEALDPLQGLEIVDHRRLSEYVFCTWYEDGTKILVNYADQAETADGVTVGGKSYKVVRE